MTRYTFVVTSKISMAIDVEAGSLEEAVRVAQGCPAMSLCHQCASGSDGEWSTTGELDCDPASGELVDAYVGDEPLDMREVPWT